MQRLKPQWQLHQSSIFGSNKMGSSHSRDCHNKPAKIWEWDGSNKDHFSADLMPRTEKNCI